ncbi:alpha/beta hydrolase [Salinactinospora qingdaonensis]|uniref:Alpha/beta fold hydrolase n=1 Tax=Salinactinospora qingdaonensis TaxID=702744 RepID=A0ABP7GBQ8_9ACTN
MNPRTTGTIVLIHGPWLTPAAWHPWVARYTAAGYRTLAPAWPGMSDNVAALRLAPQGLEDIGVGEIVDHYERIIRDLDEPPIIMGHSLGGAVTQILLDRGLGMAGVAINSSPIKGVLRLPLPTLRSAFPILRIPKSRTGTVGLSLQDWHQWFCNTLDREDSDTLYARHHVPTPGRPLWQVATANLTLHPATEVNLDNNERAPLLLISGGADRLSPPWLSQETVKRYRAPDVTTEHKEFPGRPNFTIGVSGWERVADYALSWAAPHHSIRSRLPQP